MSDNQRDLRSRRAVTYAVVLALAAALSVSIAQPAPPPGPIDGKAVFRFDTFGDEQLWTTVLRMHEVIQSSVSPVTALGVGLKVDSEVLPPDFLATHDLNDPATTVELIRLNAVVGLMGRVSGRKLKSVGITCALCHSTVDDSVARGIGKRRDG
jgi:hypothetical protein